MAVVVHIAGVVVWMGAVAYYLLILRQAMEVAGLERKQRYALLTAIKHRLRIVVGTAIGVIIASGLVLARLRGLLTRGEATPLARHVFDAKMAIVAVLVFIFLFALRLLQFVKVPKWRGRLFNWTHGLVLLLGLVAAALGVVLSRA